MPRPKRAQGRPGTRVIPKDWEASHAIVASKTMTGTCVITPQSTADVEPVMNADLTYDTPTPPTAIYTGRCRVQALKAKDASSLMGEQDQRTSAYLVTIDRSAAAVPVGALVKITCATDDTLDTPRRLVVTSMDRGTLRFERDLYCVDDMTREAT